MRDTTAARRLSRRETWASLGATVVVLALMQLPACESGDESLGAGDPELLYDDEEDPVGSSSETDAAADGAPIADAGSTFVTPALRRD